MVGITRYLSLFIFVTNWFVLDDTNDLAKMVSEEFSQLQETLVQIQNEVLLIQNDSG